MKETQCTENAATSRSQRSPLVLALCQVRLSPVPQMERYIPAIHEVFRRRGLPIERAGKVHQVTFRPSGGEPVQVMEQQRWEYRNRDETWSILLMQDTVILQTTAYTRFEDFVERLRMAVHTVLAESEHDRLGVVHRVGLRYIDVVSPSGGKDFRFYLRPGLHGVPGRSVPAWPTPPSHREQGPHRGRRESRHDGCAHRSERPGVIAAAGSRGRCAELHTLGWKRGSWSP